MFSFIIATRNRAALLTKTIQSILNQRLQNFEIIVSDDGSTDITKEIVESFNDSRIIRIFNKISCGLSNARNAAIKFTKGDYIILLDDDAVLKEDFLKRLDSIVQGNKIKALCPIIIDPDTHRPFLAPLLNKKRGYLSFFDFNYFLGGAHILSKEIINKIGYYDENFGAGAKYFSAEESDLFFRIKRTGEKILFCPELVVYHPAAENPEPSKVFNYSYGISAMLTKQLLSDTAHFYLYFWIIMRRLAISSIRATQYTLFPKSVESKNKIYKYKYFFKGTIAGIIDYLRFR